MCCENLDKLVVKAVGEIRRLWHADRAASSTAAQREEFKRQIEADPRNYIAQPTICVLARAMPDGDGSMEPRHVDLRPYILYGDKVTIVPGGLTRVALRKRLAGGEFVAGRRQQGYLGAEPVTDLCRRSQCFHASPTVCTG